MSSDDNAYLTFEEVQKVRKIIKREEFSEEAHQKIIVGAVSISKFIIEAGKVLATIAIAVAFLKGWAADFVIGVLGGRK